MQAHTLLNTKTLTIITLIKPEAYFKWFYFAGQVFPFWFPLFEGTQLPNSGCHVRNTLELNKDGATKQRFQRFPWKQTKAMQNCEM